MRLEYMSLDTLKAWPGNPKKHDKVNLAESIARFGFIAPPVIDEKTGRLVAGHGRVEALLERKASGALPPLGIQKDGDTWLLPVLRGVEFASEEEAEAYLIADNRLTEKGGWDTKQLTEMFQALAKTDVTLTGSGFSFKDTKDILREVHDETRPTVGRTPAELKAGFDAADEKQIVLYFEEAQYNAFVSRLDAARVALKAESNSEALLKLIAHYEAKRVPRSTEG